MGSDQTKFAALIRHIGGDLISEDEIEALAVASRLRHFEKGETIIAEGEVPPELFILVSGVVRGYLLDASGKEVTDCVLGTPGMVAMPYARLDAPSPELRPGAQHHRPARRRHVVHRLPAQDQPRAQQALYINTAGRLGDALGGGADLAPVHGARALPLVPREVPGHGGGRAGASHRVVPRHDARDALAPARRAARGGGVSRPEEQSAEPASAGAMPLSALRTLRERVPRGQSARHVRTTIVNQ